MKWFKLLTGCLTLSLPLSFKIWWTHPSLLRIYTVFSNWFNLWMMMRSKSVTLVSILSDPHWLHLEHRSTLATSWTSFGGIAPPLDVQKWTLSIFYLNIVTAAELIAWTDNNNCLKLEVLILFKEKFWNLSGGEEEKESDQIANCYFSSKHKTINFFFFVKVFQKNFKFVFVLTRWSIKRQKLTNFSSNF